MSDLLIVEDGTEYLDFFQLFLEEEYRYHHAQAGEAALAVLEAEPVALVVLDMRFERSPAEDLLGDASEVSERYFGGDLARAHRYIEDNQGALILGEMRAHGFDQPVLFVSDMPERKLDNLRKLYGKVHAVPSFDAGVIRRKLEAMAAAEGHL